METSEPYRFENGTLMPLCPSCHMERINFKKEMDSFREELAKTLSSVVAEIEDIRKLRAENAELKACLERAESDNMMVRQEYTYFMKRLGQTEK